MQWLRHAFAVDPPGPAEPTEAQRPVVERICREVVRRRLTTPALLFLEMSRPLNSVGAHLLHFFTPVLSVFTDATHIREFARFLERRGSIDHLCRRIEALEANDAQDARASQSLQPRPSAATDETSSENL